MGTDENDWLVKRFEERRPQLRAVAYRMLGSLAEAEEAVQDAWVRASAAGAEGIDSVDGWLTTIVARVCLNQLRARRGRREDAAGDDLPDPVVEPEAGSGPERTVALADSIGLALLLVLDTLEPAERLAFVLHDMFDVPFEEIATVMERSPGAARQLASRARRRVRGAAKPEAPRDPVRERQVVDAFFAAARDGSFDALVSVLHPDVVLRSIGGGDRPDELVVVHGAAQVAGRALQFRTPAAGLQPARINGAPGVVVTVGGKPVAVMAFTVESGVVTGIHAYAGARLRGVDLTAFVR